MILRLGRRCYIRKMKNSLSKNYDTFLYTTMKTFHLINYHKVKGSHKWELIFLSIKMLCPAYKNDYK